MSWTDALVLLGIYAVGGGVCFAAPFVIDRLVNGSRRNPR